MKTLSGLITQFLKYIEVERDRAQTTVSNYRLYLTRFERWASSQGIKTPDMFTQNQVDVYKEWLRWQGGKKGFKKNTFNYHLIALRSFLRYAQKQSIKTMTPEKIFLARTPARNIDILSSDEVKSLLAAPLLSGEPGIIKKRDTALLALLAHTGSTVSELARITRSDMDKQLYCIVIRGGKGKKNKYRSVPISDQAKNALDTYLSARTDSYAPLFIRHDRAFNPRSKKKDGPNLFLTPRSIQRLVQRYGKIAGLSKPITPHTLRHSFAAETIAKGADIKSVQLLMGHANVLTTQVYTRSINKL